MKNYIKLGLIALSLAFINPIQSMHYEGFERMNPTNDHSEWVHNNEAEQLKRREDVKAPGSDIEWGKHIFTGDKKLENLGKKISGTSQRIGDWLSDWWNNSSLFGKKNQGRRTIVSDSFKQYSDSNEQNKKLDDQAKEAFIKLRPDIQLKYINEFAKKEKGNLDSNTKDLSKQITSLQKDNETLEKSIKKDLIPKFNKKLKEVYPNKSSEEIQDIQHNESFFKEFIKELKTSQHRTPGQDDLLNQHEEIVKRQKQIRENKTTIETTQNNIKNLETAYFNRLNKFRQEINELTQNDNRELKYNTTTNAFEFHNPESLEGFRNRVNNLTKIDFSGLPEDTKRAQQATRNVDYALKQKEEEIAQENLQRAKEAYELAQKKSIAEAKAKQEEMQKNEADQRGQITSETDQEFNQLMEKFKTNLSTKPKVEATNNEPTKTKQETYEDSIKTIINSNNTTQKFKIVGISFILADISDDELSNLLQSPKLNANEKIFVEEAIAMPIIKNLETITSDTTLTNEQREKKISAIVENISKVKMDIIEKTDQFKTWESNLKNTRIDNTKTNPAAQNSSNASPANDNKSDDNKNEQATAPTTSEKPASTSTVTEPAPKKSNIDVLREQIQAKINELEVMNLYGHYEKQFNNIKKEFAQLPNNPSETELDALDSNLNVLKLSID